MACVPTRTLSGMRFRAAELPEREAVVTLKIESEKTPSALPHVKK